ncbi:MAG: hypothetical protein QXD13_00630, partial [Candidatus Pacearchaeota archaeon]
IVLSLASFASAEIFIGNPENLYNIGDRFSINVTIASGLDTSDFLFVKLICSQNDKTREVEIYRVPYTTDAGKQKSITIDGTFDNFLVGDLEGNCFLYASYGNSSAKSREFEITRAIDLSIQASKAVVMPGEQISIVGTAVKKNGQNLNGFIESEIKGTNIKLSGAVAEGKFELALKMPENSPAGNYQIISSAYERDNFGKIKNKGEHLGEITIKQVIRKLGIAVNSQQIIPGNELLYTIILYDQTNKEMKESAEVSILNPSNELILKKLADSGKTNNLTLAKNSASGYWKIKASANGIFGEQDIYIEELQEVDFELADNVLTVTNIGNVPYKKKVEITIGNVTEVKEIELNAGESKKFMLSAPEGEYSITAGDDSKKESLGASFLTGSAISVDDGESGFLGKSSIILWIMLICIVAFIAFYHFERTANKAYYGKTPRQSFTPVKLSPASSNNKNENIINEGQREECSIILLKVDNLSKESADALSRALLKAKENKAKMFSEGAFRTIVFAPSITGEQDNSLRAVKTAKEMEAILKEFNASSPEKIKFGIGVHNGPLILGKSGDGNFKVSAVDSSMVLVKKIAEKAHMDIGVSSTVHRRLLGKVKSERIAGDEFWRITKIMQREAYSDFINKFVSKQQQEAKERERKSKEIK